MFFNKLAQKLYRRENWLYNQEERYFLCPNQKKLVFVQTQQVRSQNDYLRTLDIYQCESCWACPFFKACRGENADPQSNRLVQVSKRLEAYKEKAKALFTTRIEQTSTTKCGCRNPFWRY